MGSARGNCSIVAAMPRPRRTTATGFRQIRTGTKIPVMVTTPTKRPAAANAPAMTPIGIAPATPSPIRTATRRRFCFSSESAERAADSIMRRGGRSHRRSAWTPTTASRSGPAFRSAFDSESPRTRRPRAETESRRSSIPACQPAGPAGDAGRLAIQEYGRFTAKILRRLADYREGGHTGADDQDQLWKETGRQPSLGRCRDRWKVCDHDLMVTTEERSQPAAGDVGDDPYGRVGWRSRREQRQPGTDRLHGFLDGDVSTNDLGKAGPGPRLEEARQGRPLHVEVNQ